MYNIIASEHRSWTLLYSVPILDGILHNDYLEHYKLFVRALWLLLQQSITLADVDKAEELLQQFSSKFASYYGK